jgi:hypothetical protein
VGKQELAATGDELRDVGTRVEFLAELADAIGIGARVLGVDRERVNPNPKISGA